AYLARLYGALRGKGEAVSVREAKNAARTFANFMAYKPVRSIDQFVAGEVLEAREFGDTIKRIRDLLRTVHGMEQEAARVRGAVGLLEQARQLTEDYQNSWLERTGLDYAAAAQNWQQNRKQYVAAKNKQQELQARIDDLTDEQQLNDERTQQAHRDLVQLEARRQGIPALQGKDDLENRQQLLTTRLQQGVAPLLEQAHQRDLKIGRAACREGMGA